MKFGWIAVPDQLHALDVLANNWIIAIAALGALAEFFADKIAWVDSAWDAVHAVVRPIGGALLSMAIIEAATRRGRSAASCSAAARRSWPMPARPARERWSTPAPSRFPTSSCRPPRTSRPAGLLALAIANPIAAALIALILVLLSLWLVVAARRALQAASLNPNGGGRVEP